MKLLTLFLIAVIVIRGEEPAGAADEDISKAVGSALAFEYKHYQSLLKIILTAPDGVQVEGVRKEFGQVSPSILSEADYGKKRRLCRYCNYFDVGKISKNKDTVTFVGGFRPVGLSGCEYKYTLKKAKNGWRVARRDLHGCALIQGFVWRC